MRQVTRWWSLPIFAALVACTPPEPPVTGNGALADGHTSRNALDWDGVYTGVVPCADCEGIRTRIELTRDGTYSRSLVYLGRDERAITDSGRFEWDDAGLRITLGEGERSQQYHVGELVLFHLDRSGERIIGEFASAYRLEKTVNDPLIEDRRWVLVELNGRTIEESTGGERAYLELDGAKAQMAGKAFCNRYFGGYELHTGGRLRFGTDIGSTMMACPDLDSEREFFDILGRVDNYTLGDGMLSLNRARMAPLALFRDAGAAE
jgi:copper homeostasis protein (lipoprotein)